MYTMGFVHVQNNDPITWHLARLMPLSSQDGFITMARV